MQSIHADLTIVIPTFNRLREIDSSLRVLLVRLTRLNSEIEIIVVDDGSDDGMQPYLERFMRSESLSPYLTLRLIRTFKSDRLYRNPGFARNAGLKAARGRFVAFMDCDVLHCTDPVSATLAEFKADPDVYLTGVFLLAELKKFSIGFLGPYGANNDIPHGGWLAAPRARLIEIGGYDERYLQYGNEDHDIVQRLRRSGLRHRSCASIMYVHPHQDQTGHEDLSGALADYQMDLQRSDNTIARNVDSDWGEYSEVELALSTDDNVFPVKRDDNLVDSAHGVKSVVSNEIAEIRFSLHHLMYKLDKLAKVPSMLRNVHTVTASLEAGIFRGGAVKTLPGVFGGQSYFQLKAVEKYRRVMICAPDERLINRFLEDGVSVEVVAVSDSEAIANPVELFDVVWNSNLHRVRNVGIYLANLLAYLKSDGVLVINVPCATHSLGSGNLTLWNAGLLIYNLVRAGVDCRSCRVRTSDSIVSLLVKISGRRVPVEIGFTDLAEFFPVPVGQHFDGRIKSVNWMDD